MARILLEIIASSVEDCIAAESGGADRIELCAAIATAGLTPSLGTLIEAKERVAHSRDGDGAAARRRFHAIPTKTSSVMQRDAALLLEHGADGIVFGILHADGSIDMKRCAKIRKLAGTKQTVFHRAFDVVARPAARAGPACRPGLHPRAHQRPKENGKRWDAIACGI